tara:strand:- start:75 stop:344 length:270 start_codon:yes stop_codon:yes gene_type:complete
MPKKPYPGFDPSKKSVRKVGGLSRNCFVCEVLSDEPLSNTQKAAIEEHTQAYLQDLVNLMPGIRKAEIIHPDRFDPLVVEGLRLKEPDQ